MIHKRSLGATGGVYWLTLVSRKHTVMYVVTLKPKMGWVIGSFLYTKIGGNTAHYIEGSRSDAH